MYIDFPDISPVIFSIGPFSFRWYAMAYLAGIVAAWLLTKRNIAKYNLGITNEQLDDLVFYTTLGIILGGRIGYVVCYGDGYFWKHPSEIIAVWHGGMSFHGGITGVILGLFCFARRYAFPFLKITDIVALYVPIGIFWAGLPTLSMASYGGGLQPFPGQLNFRKEDICRVILRSCMRLQRKDF